MLSRRELLVKYCNVMSFDELCNEISNLIETAAKAGLRHITYVFPKNADKETIDGIYVELGSLDYDVNYNVNDPYSQITISW